MKNLKKSFIVASTIAMGAGGLNAPVMIHADNSEAPTLATKATTTAEAKEELESAKSNLSKAEDAYQKAKAELDTAADNADKAEKAASEAKTKAADAEKGLASAVQSAKDTAAEATSKAEEALKQANDEKTAADKAVKDAEATVKDAKDKVAVANDALNKAVKADPALAAKVDADNKAIDAAKADADAAKAKVDEGTAYAEKAEGLADAADQKVKDAEDADAKAKKAVEDAKAAIDAPKKDDAKTDGETEADKLAGFNFINSNCSDTYKFDSMLKTIRTYVDAHKDEADNNVVKAFKDVSDDEVKSYIEDLFSKEGLAKDADLVAEANTLRADKTNYQGAADPLKIGYDNMMYSAFSNFAASKVQVYALAEAKLGIPSTVENLAWGCDDPFDAWYKEEKKAYDSGTTDYGKTGHYLNLAGKDQRVAGLTFSAEHTAEMNFSTADDAHAVSPDDFKKALESYIADAGKTADTDKKDTVAADEAAKAYNDAVEAKKKTEQALADAKDDASTAHVNLMAAKNNLKNLQKAYDEKKDAVDKAQAKLDDDLNTSETAGKAKKELDAAEEALAKAQADLEAGKRAVEDAGTKAKAAEEALTQAKAANDKAATIDLTKPDTYKDYADITKAAAAKSDADTKLSDAEKAYKDALAAKNDKSAALTKAKSTYDSAKVYYDVVEKGTKDMINADASKKPDAKAAAGKTDDGAKKDAKAAQNKSPNTGVETPYMAYVLGLGAIAAITFIEIKKQKQKN